MDKNAAKRWRPVIETLFDTLTRQEALDATLLLLEAPSQKIVTAPEKPDAEAPRRVQLRAVPGGRSDDDREPWDEKKEPLDPLAFFTVDEAAAFLDIGRDRMYQLLRSEGDRLPRKKEGRNYRVSGRALNVYRYERMRKGAPSNDEARSE